MWELDVRSKNALDEALDQNIACTVGLSDVDRNWKKIEKYSVEGLLKLIRPSVYSNFDVLEKFEISIFNLLEYKNEIL